jgi:hypothetical protein
VHKCFSLFLFLGGGLALRNVLVEGDFILRELSTKALL